MLTYSKTVEQLFNLQRFSIKMGLDNINSICIYLNNPQKVYPTIHVAGTNGKGSTSILIQKILAAHGLIVGLYTSPHLADFRERIRVNDDLIEEIFIRQFWDMIKLKIKALKATFFDTTTAMAFEYFKIRKVDVAVIETGLGGRLDSTNILNPVVTVLTPIDIDHVKQLGTDIRQIAHEKAAIIKNGVTLFLGKQHDAAKLVLRTYYNKTRQYFNIEKAINIRNIETFLTHSHFDLIDQDRKITFSNLSLNLAGEFQIENAGLAYMVARWYLKYCRKIFYEKKMRIVLENIIWPGRLQRLSRNPDIYLDVSHNYSGFKHTLDFIKNHKDKRKTHLLIGLLEDKQYDSIIALILDYFSFFVITEPLNERKISGRILQEEFSKYGINAKLIKDIDKAFEFSIMNTPPDHTLFVMGSHFLIGKLLEGINKKILT